MTTARVRESRKDRAKAVAATITKLDLACGQNKHEGFTGIDAVATSDTDFVWDLTVTPWRFVKIGEIDLEIPADSIQEVVCSHFFEHLTGEQRIAFMHELYRILVPGGTAQIITPYYSSMRAVQDPTHKFPPVCEASYLYFNQGWLRDNKLDHYDIHCDFDFSYAYNVDNNVASRTEEYRAMLIRNQINTVNDLIVNLVKRK